MRIRVLFIVLVAALFGAPGLSAQEEPVEEKTLVGQVIDSDTGTPLLGAFVHLQDEKWGVLTGDDGTFVLPRLPSGRVSVVAEQLGYVNLVQVFRMPGEDDQVLFALTPDPILLEGIEVVMDRFESRRRAYAHSLQLLDREALVTSTAYDLVDLIESRSFLHPYPCPPTEMEQTCAVIRGRVRRVAVYVDEIRFWGGLDYLTMVQPQELHMVEIFSSRGQVRVYTEGYMERVGNRPVAVMPLHW